MALLLIELFRLEALQLICEGESVSVSQIDRADLICEIRTTNFLTTNFPPSL
jgi:hypothetical protein